MDNSFQTSFIPKKPIESNVSNKTPFSLLTLIAVFVLILTIVGTAGLFFYKIYLKNHKENLSESLQKAKDSFEKETIDELELFSKRTETAKQILDEHIVLSPMFSLIGEITIPTIQYTKFSHQTTDNGFLVKMEGLAQDYKSIALQSEMFNSDKGQLFKNVVFSDLIRNNSNTSGNNYITFDVEFNVDPSLLSYDKNQLMEQPINTNPLDPSLNPGQPNLNNNTQ